MNIVGRRINKKDLYIKAYRMLLDVLGNQYGGGGGNRTRVRKPSAIGSTCLDELVGFNLVGPIRKAKTSEFVKFRILCPNSRRY